MTTKEFMAKSGIELGKGYDLLWSALDIKVENQEISFARIKMIIANKEGCCSDAIEQSIGRAIKKGFLLMDSQLKNVLFKGHDKPPSTAKYVQIVAYAISRGII